MKLLTRTVAILLGSVLTANAAGPTPRQIEFFENRIRPVLAQHCQECHGVKKQESGLRLDAREFILKGGDSGPAMVLGKPDESLLIEAVRHESFEMPPAPADPLDEGDIGALTRWVKMGAPWPQGDMPTGPMLGDQEYIGKQAADHWSFQPIEKPELPEVPEELNARNPIDRFVVAELREQNLTLSEQADRRTLIRRITFDLTGLPPTEGEIADFVNDKDPDAYRKVVDRLLASPHFGERWGRHWLDIARYADTRDWFPQIDPRYPYAWTYRDWVVRAFNEDMPYDQFLKYQIAADQLVEDEDSQHLAALGLLTVGPRFRNNVQEQISDRIDVVTRGVLGLTVTCARCHDHKYDPIPIEDYYSLYGVFASSEIPDELPLIEGFPVPEKEFQEFQQARAEKQAALDKYKQGLQTEAHRDLRKRPADYLIGYYEMNVTKKESIRSLISKRKLKETAMTPLAQNLDRAARQKQWREHPVLGAYLALVRVPEKQFEAKREDLLKTYGEKINPLVQGALTENPPKNSVELQQTFGELLKQAQVKFAQTRQQNPEATVLDDSHWEQVRQVLYDPKGPFVLNVEAVTAASRLLGKGRVALAKVQNAVKEIEVSHPGSPARAMVMVDAERPMTPAVFLRGDSRRRGDRVPRQFLEVIAGEDRQPFSKDASGRRELAEAIVAKDNPLTARVMVNRVWMHLFDQGLVSTPGDFGLRSDPPTHPELLDWMSNYFIHQDWSVKQLIRMIVLSRTYRQSSEIDERHATIDPDNRYLWRANRKRLDFEAMRDAMLVAGGEIDLSVGGKPEDLTAEPFTTRRTVYGFIDRVNLDPIYSTFDFATPDQSTPERAETMVPQQALFAMNHPFVIEQARKLAHSSEFQVQQTPQEKVKYLYRHLFGREATSEEVRLTVNFIESTGTGTSPLSGPWRYGYGTPDHASLRADGFHEFKLFTGQNYQYATEFPHPNVGHLRIGNAIWHPGRSEEYAAIKRWISPVAGSIKITGELEHLRDKGDGVHVQIIAGEGGQLGEWTVLKSSANTEVKEYTVSVGETIDFVLDKNGNTNSDASRWTPVITLLEQTGGPSSEVKVWNALRDFQPPPPSSTRCVGAGDSGIDVNQRIFIHRLTQVEQLLYPHLWISERCSKTFEVGRGTLLSCLFFHGT